MYVYKLAREERENHQAWKKCKWKSQVIEIAIWIFNTRNQKKNPFLSSGKKAPFSSFFFWIWMKNVKKRNPTEMMMMLMRWQRMTDWLIMIIIIIMIGKEKEGKVERSRLKTFFFTTTTNMSYIKQSYGNWIEKLNWQCHHQLSWYTLGISF